VFQAPADHPRIRLTSAWYPGLPMEDIKIETHEYTEHLIESARKNGVSAAKVTDGVVLLFSREKLTQLLENMGDDNVQIVFVKDVDPNRIQA
jgi:predicted O-methyltransferase YrrM